MTMLLNAFAMATPIPTTVEIAPGVNMPYINLGGVHSHPSNYSAWLELGGVGLDSALMYGDDVQVQVGSAAKASGIERKKLFITSKVPCCPAPFTKWCTWMASEYPAKLAADMQLLASEALPQFTHAFTKLSNLAHSARVVPDSSKGRVRQGAVQPAGSRLA